MYLKRLYHQSKTWFVILLLFTMGQLYINYKRGLVISPFFHYAMFSSPVVPQSTYEVPEVWVNGKQLQTKDFSPNEWDNLVIPIVYYRYQQDYNAHVFVTGVQHFLHIKDSTKYVNHITDETFKNWYIQQVRQIVNANDKATVEYRLTNYNYSNNRLNR